MYKKLLFCSITILLLHGCQSLPYKLVPIDIPKTGFKEFLYGENNSSTLYLSPNIKLRIPNDVISLSLYLQGDSVFAIDSDLQFNRLISPSGDEIDLVKTQQKCSREHSYCASFIPRLTGQELYGGTWYINLISRSPISVADHELKMTVITKRGNKEELINSRASLQVISIALDSFEHEQEVLSNVTEYYNKYGINITFLNLKNEKKPTKELVDGTFVHLMNSNYINIVFGHNITEYFNLKGAAGYTLGTPGQLGGDSLLSGIFINTNVSTGCSGNYCNDVLINALSNTLIHEIGHFLGLEHTSESNGYEFDSLSDTSPCILSFYDKNKNLIADENECPDRTNMMFWELGGSERTLSNEQINIIKRSPFVLTNI